MGAPQISTRTKKLILYLSKNQQIHKLCQELLLSFPHLSWWMAFLTQAVGNLLCPGLHLSHGHFVRDSCCTYPVTSPGHRFMFSFPFLIISGHRLGRSFLTSLPQQGINSDLWPLIPFSLKCQCYVGLFCS